MRLPHERRNLPGETEGSATRLRSSPASRSPCARSRDSCAGFRSPSSPERVREAPGRGEERRKSHAPPRHKAPPPSPHSPRAAPLSLISSSVSLPAPERVRSAAPRISPASGEHPEPRLPHSVPGLRRAAPLPPPRVPERARSAIRNLAQVPREAPGEHGWQDTSGKGKNSLRLLPPPPISPSPLCSHFSLLSHQARPESVPALHPPEREST